MTLTLVNEDGTGLANSNTYATTTFADDYFSNHPFYSDTWSELTTQQKERYLYHASAWVDRSFDWRGCKNSESQAMRWPRYGAFDLDGNLIGTTVIPTQLRQAVCEMALYFTKGDTSATPDSFGISDLKVDVIEIKFDKSQVLPAAPQATLRLLRGLYEGGFGSRVRKVLVG